MITARTWLGRQYYWSTSVHRDLLTVLSCLVHLVHRVCSWPLGQPESTMFLLLLPPINSAAHIYKVTEAGGLTSTTPTLTPTTLDLWCQILKTVQLLAGVNDPVPLSWVQERNRKIDVFYEVKDLVLKLILSCHMDPLVHYGRHLCRTIHALCNIGILLTNGITRFTDRAPADDFTLEFVTLIYIYISYGYSCVF
jgi:hypothetical protein